MTSNGVTGTTENSLSLDSNGGAVCTDNVVAWVLVPVEETVAVVVESGLAGGSSPFN